MANSAERFSTDAGVGSTQSSQYQKTNKQSRNSNSPRKPKRLSPFYRGLLWGAAVSITAAVSATVGATIALVSPSSLNLASLIHSLQFPLAKTTNTSQEASWGWSQQNLSRPVNILVMGIDRVPNAPTGTTASFTGHSDTMLLLRVDPSDRSVRILSIPRDSRVDIPDVGFTKINEANMYGGPALAARVVSRTLNDVPIDRYVRITSDAFRELVDLVDGVEVFVPYAMSYRDATQNLEIDLQAGWQTLNGEQAEEFARFRSDRMGDIGRVQRQQVLLKALQKRLYNADMLPRLPQAIRILQQHIDTNLSLDEMLALASFGQDLSEENLRMVMLPGRFSQKEEYEAKSYWIIAERERDRIVDEHFNRAAQYPVETVEPQQVRIALQNATNDPGLANRVLDYLAGKEFRHIYIVQDSSELLEKTEIIVQKGNLAAADTLKSALGVGRVEASSIGDLDSDLTIKLGLDAKQLLVGDSFLKTSVNNESNDQ
jgi:LCP family protein required for cell wall assembly